MVMVVVTALAIAMILVSSERLICVFYW